MTATDFAHLRELVLFVRDYEIEDARHLAESIPEADRAKWSRLIEDAETDAAERAHEAFCDAYYGGDCSREVYERNDRRGGL